MNEILLADAATTKVLGDVIKFPPLIHQIGSIGYIEKMMIGLLVLVSQPKVIVETGVFKGQTTRFISEFLFQNGLEAQVVGFDLPEVVDELSHNAFLRGASNVELIAGRLPDSLRRWLSNLKEPIGLAIIDSGHSFNAVFSELSLLHSHLCPGGYFFCHDYRESDGTYEGTVVAIDSFARRYGYDKTPLNPSTHQGEEVVWGCAILRKPLVGKPLLHAARFRVASTVKYWFKKASRLSVKKSSA